MAKRILVVDDSDIMRGVARGILQKGGYEVVEAWDAAQARAALKRDDIAFVFCDLNIPGMNGLELAELMQQIPGFESLPFAIVSAERSSQLLSRARRAGVKEWVTKPYSAETLLSMVEKFTGPPSE